VPLLSKNKTKIEEEKNYSSIMPSLSTLLCGLVLYKKEILKQNLAKNFIQIRFRTMVNISSSTPPPKLAQSFISLGDQHLIW